MNNQRRMEMSSDGASMGVGASRAIGTILGGEEQPSDDERKTPEQMMDEIRNQEFENLDYGSTSMAVARLILEAYEKYPEIQNVPKECVYLRDASNQMVWPAVTLTTDLYKVLKEIHSEDQRKLDILKSLTGFMWGWAVNVVQYAMDLPEQPNPAIMSIGGTQEAGD
jgi:hypothetical protein